MKTKELMALALMLVSGFALAEKVSSPDQAIVELPCPDMTYFSNPRVEVKITQDSKTEDYIYHYVFHLNSGEPVPRLIALRSFADSAIEYRGAGFSSCNLTRRNKFQEPTVLCHPKPEANNSNAMYELTLRSKSRPGIIAYEVESATTKGIWTPGSFTQLETQFRGDRTAVFESVQDAIAEQCPSARVSNDRERRLVGLVQGPAAQSALLAKGEKSGATIEIFADKISDLKLVDLTSLNITDPLGRRYAIKQPQVATKAGTYQLEIVENEPPVPCNIKFLAVNGRLEDGRLFKVAVPSGSPACQPSPLTTFKVQASQVP